jgi:hypothetical protein
MPPLLRPSQTAAWLLAFALSLGAVGCVRQDTRLEQHRKKFASLGETTAATVNGWLTGQLSGTFATAALETTFRLVEQERSSLAASPSLLQDPRGARLSETSERLSRLLAAAIRDVADANADAARQHLAELPLRAAGQP